MIGFILNNLHSIRKKIHKRYSDYKVTRKLLDNLLNPKNNVIVPVTPEHTNLGDHAIVIAQMSFLTKCGYDHSRIKEITTSEYSKYSDHIKRKISKHSLIAQLGGGNMGNQWMMEERLHEDLVIGFSKNQEIIFPQTIYFTADEKGEKFKSETIPIYNGRSNLLMVAREKTSYDIMSTLYPDTERLLIPDIVLSTTPEVFGVAIEERKGIMLCMRSDAERSMADDDFYKILSYLNEKGLQYAQTDMHAEGAVSKDNRSECVRTKMMEFAKSEVVITDRLHGMIFAAITGTPCIVFSNYNHKVKGTYDWISYLPYIKYAESYDDMVRFLPELLKMKNCKFNNTPLLPYYEKLAEVVKNHAQN